MSIFGALSTAVSGLTAQSHAFSDISNNLANSQTTGYKATETSFSDYVQSSTMAQGTSETVRASTTYRNDAQGTITSSSNSLALAISGNGFFNVAEANGNSTATRTEFDTTNYYTRNGDFTEDNQGYLVNSSNDYLKAYTVNADGTLDTSQLAPVNVSNVTFRPTETTSVSYSANLPGGTAATDGTAAAGATTQDQTIYDSSGAEHDLSFEWTPSADADGSWTVTASVDGAVKSAARVRFGADGTMSSVEQQTNPGTEPATYAAATNTEGANAAFTIPTGLSGDDQTITVDLGTIGSSNGTRVATGAADPGSAGTTTSDSVTSGAFTGISMTSDGAIMATFDNGQSQAIAKIPLATFANSNALVAHDGQAYTASARSGAATQSLADENGAGTLETSSIESSTTSMDTDLTRLITAQQAYSANAKVITAANDLLQTALAMKQ